jgi:Zinc carboxypeptidase
MGALTLGVFWLLVSNPLLAHSERSDSGIYGPKYQVIVKQFQDLVESFPNELEWVEYGQSIEKRPLFAVIHRRWVRREAPTLILTGSTHGDEYLNLEDRLPQEFIKEAQKDSPFSQFLNEGGVFIYIPIVNPDGYDARSRENMNGADLNRDWDLKLVDFKGFNEPETKSLSEFVAKQTVGSHPLSISVTVDYHCCAGAILYPWSYTSNPLPKVDLDLHKSLSVMAENLIGISSGTTDEILGYKPVGTTKDYYYSTYRAAAFTYEGEYGVENKNLSKHLAWWRSMVSRYLSIRPQFLSFLTLN